MGILDSLYFDPQNQGMGLLGAMPFAQRWGAVDSALDRGQFDPRGVNNMPPQAGIPMPQPRPDSAPQMPANAMPVQGPIPPQMAPMFAQAPQQQPQMPQMPEPGIMDRLGAALGSFANSTAPLPAIANLIGGLVTGQRQDPMGMAQSQLDNARRAAVQYVAGASDISPEMKIAMIQNPNLAVKYLADRSKTPEYKFEKAGQYYGRFNPQSGRFDVQGAAPEFKTFSQGENAGYFTPPTPGQPGSVTGIQQAGPKFSDVASIRKEVSDLPETKRYGAALPIFRSMVTSHTRAAKNPGKDAVDIDFVYGLAKIFDPESVVREGEMLLVKKLQSLPEALQGWIQQVNSGNGLTASARARILETARVRMGELKGSLDERLTPYGGIAERNRINPDDIMPKFQDLPDAPKVTQGQAMEDARNAIKKGVPRGEVIKRMIEQGFSTKGL